MMDQAYLQEPTSWKYLIQDNSISWILDHRITPETRALFAAMASRLPDGGIEARYKDIVSKVFLSMQNRLHDHGQHGAARDLKLSDAEDRLTTYPLHPVVQQFFDDKVKKYGHSSPLELTGDPAVYIQGVSPFTAYLSFDSPLVAGQEFSTRAVRRRSWPMCHEAFVSMREYKDIMGSEWLDAPLIADRGRQGRMPHPALYEIHKGWLNLFESQVEAWKIELRLPCESCRGRGFVPHRPDHEECTSCSGTGKKYPFIKDPQVFRPALDRSRCCIPSTISTGFCHTAHTRAMGRVIHTGIDFGTRKVHCKSCNGVGSQTDYTENAKPVKCSACNGQGKWTQTSVVWTEIKKAYESAMPGMAGMWTREAVADVKQSTRQCDCGTLETDEAWEKGERGCPDCGAVWPERLRFIHQVRPLPYHLQIGFVPPSKEVDVRITQLERSLIPLMKRIPKRKHRQYLDPIWNQLVRVDIAFQCSWAVARDWHRHRTAFPWKLDIVRDGLVGSKVGFSLHPAYRILKEEHEAKAAQLLIRSMELFDRFKADGDMEKAMLCVPFGALVSVRTNMGLRDAVYMLELRANAHGANFEYEAQAKKALELLKEQLGRFSELVFPV